VLNGEEIEKSIKFLVLEILAKMAIFGQAILEKLAGDV